MFELGVGTEESSCCLSVEARCEAEVLDVEERLEGFKEVHAGS